MTLIYGLPLSPQQRYYGVTNAELIHQANRSPAFGLDSDITTELERRRICSAGRFDYRFVHNQLIILKDEKS